MVMVMVRHDERAAATRRPKTLLPLCDCGRHYTWEGAWRCLQKSKLAEPKG